MDFNKREIRPQEQYLNTNPHKLIDYSSKNDAAMSLYSILDRLKEMVENIPINPWACDSILRT